MSAGRLLAACAVIALVLVGVQHAARLLRPSGGMRSRGSLLAILETTFLPGSASLHVVRVCDRYYVVGRSGASVRTLCEIPSEDVASAQARAGPLSGTPLGALRDALTSLRRRSR